jgi:hypothetical protein
MTLQSPPDERLSDLMDTEKQRQGGQSDVSVALVYVANGIDPDRADDGATDEISLRRKAHLGAGQTELVSSSRPRPVLDERHHLFRHYVPSRRPFG